VLATAEIFEFEDFRLDRREGLSQQDEWGVFVSTAIGPRALDVLAVLVERPGELVLKEEIMAAVWGRAVVENANLTVQISALRRVLDQGRSGRELHPDGRRPRLPVHCTGTPTRGE